MLILLKYENLRLQRNKEGFVETKDQEEAKEKK